MVSKESWRDFAILTNRIERIQSLKLELQNEIARLKKDDKDIIKNSERKAEVKKILDIHHFWTLVKLEKEIGNIIK